MVPNPFAVRCPTCAAAAGTGCISPLSGEPREAHKDRATLATFCSTYRDFAWALPAAAPAQMCEPAGARPLPSSPSEPEPEPVQ